MVTIVDYGIGNLRSIEKAFEHEGVEVVRTDDPGRVASAQRLVLPGVGAFGACMHELEDRGLVAPIRKAVSRGIPFLGVCVGMQLLFEVGEERGTHEGLGLLSGRVVRFQFDGTADGGRQLKVPHMGWNTITPTRSHPLFEDIDSESFFYFVHSYHATCEEHQNVLATSDYGIRFPAVVQRNNVMGVQFHPEKSQQNGLTILRNFAHLPPGEPAADFE